MSWPVVKLGKLVSIKGGGTPSKNVDEYWNGSIPWASVKDIKTRILQSTVDSITQEGVDNSATNIIPKGTIIIPTRMALGKVAITGCNLAINQDLKALFINDVAVVDRDYLARFIESRAGYIEGEGKGATVKGITLDFLKSIEIPLPPIAEQKRIAAILDKADAIRQKRQRAIKLADEFLRSVFLEMFGDPVTNPKGLEVVSLIDICNKVTDGTHQSPKWQSEGVPFLFISNIVDGKINYETDKYISHETLKELTKSTPIEKDDILYTTVGSYGNVALVPGDREFCFQRHIAHIKPNGSLVKADFLASMLSSSAIRRQADRLVRGIAQKTLNLRELKEIKVFNLSLEEQEHYLAIAQPVNRMKNKYILSAHEADTAFKSLSQKVFSGQL